MVINKEHEILIPNVLRKYVKKVAPELQVAFIQDKDYDIIDSSETDILWIGVIKLNIPRLEKTVIVLLNGETNTISVLDYNGKRIVKLYGSVDDSDPELKMCVTWFGYNDKDD